MPTHYLMIWKVRFQRVLEKKWVTMRPMKARRWESEVLYIWSAGVGTTNRQT